MSNSILFTCISASKCMLFCSLCFLLSENQARVFFLSEGNIMYYFEILAIQFRQHASSLSEYIKFNPFYLYFGKQVHAVCSLCILLSENQARVFFLSAVYIMYCFEILVIQQIGYCHSKSAGHFLKTNSRTCIT